MLMLPYVYSILSASFVVLDHLNFCWDLSLTQPEWRTNFADLCADLLDPRLLVSCGDRYSTSCPSKSQGKMLILVLSTDN